MRKNDKLMDAAIGEAFKLANNFGKSTNACCIYIIYIYVCVYCSHITNTSALVVITIDNTFDRILPTDLDASIIIVSVSVPHANLSSIFVYYF